MKERRVNQSSIRYSDKVARIVNAAKGETFADKFEYIVLNYEENKEVLEKELKDVMKEIEKARKVLNGILENVDKAKSVSFDLECIVRYTESVRKKCVIQ